MPKIPIKTCCRSSGWPLAPITRAPWPAPLSPPAPQTCDRKIDKELVVDALDEEACDDLQDSERIDCIRKKHIFEVLKQCGNNKKLAAEKLGVSRTTLWRELKGI